eukprot:SAG11_NODE_1072_length_5974_cov_1.634553_5_plen_210_part_00
MCCNLSQHETSCRSGYTGPLCNLCAVSFTRLTGTGRCHSCNSDHDMSAKGEVAVSDAECSADTAPASCTARHRQQTLTNCCGEINAGSGLDPPLLGNEDTYCITYNPDGGLASFVDGRSMGDCTGFQGFEAGFLDTLFVPLCSAALVLVVAAAAGYKFLLPRIATLHIISKRYPRLLGIKADLKTYIGLSQLLSLLPTVLDLEYPGKKL